MEDFEEKKEDVKAEAVEADGSTGQVTEGVSEAEEPEETATTEETAETEKTGETAENTETIESAEDVTEGADESKGTEETSGNTEPDNRPRLNIKWNENGIAELSKSVFYHSPDTVKKGEPYDLLILFCAFFAIGCFSVMLVSGLNHGFTPSMHILMGCYVVITILCLCKPLHYALSKAVWNSGFREKFPVNKGCGTEIVLCENCFIYKDALGKEVSVDYDKMSGIYETEHYLVFHENDNSIFAAELSQLEDEADKEKIYMLLSGKMQSAASEKEQAEAEEESELASIAEELEEGETGSGEAKKEKAEADYENADEYFEAEEEADDSEELVDPEADRLLEEIKEELQKVDGFLLK